MSCKNPCSGCIDYGASYSQTARVQSQTTSDGTLLAERSQIYSSPYGVESDTSTTMSGSIGQASGSQPNSTPSTGGHFFHRGLQQSPAFNSLLSSQGQPLYNGVYGTQGGYASQNSFSTTSYNNYGHVEAPWISESRVSSSVNGVLQQIEGDRSNRTQYADKSLPCNAQNLPHTCCGSRLSIADSINMCSPLSTEAFRNVNKDITNFQHKTNSGLDSQGWFCNQAVLGYANQQNQNPQQTNYKCNEQYPSCSVSQISMLLHDQTDLKHATDSSMTNSCFDNSQNHNSCSNKQIEQCSSNSLKSICMEQNKEQSMKYCSLQKLQLPGQPVDHIALSAQQKHHQEQNGYMYSTVGELHDDALYSQASMILHMGNDGSQNTARFQPPFIASKHSLSQNNMGDISKSYAVSPVLQHFQEHGRCGLDQGISCDVVESCLQSDIKAVNEGAVNMQHAVSTSSSCCHLSVEPTNNLSQENHSMFNTQLQSQRSNVNSLPNCSVVGQRIEMCSNAPSSQQLPIECSEVDGKEDCSSVAGESDIIVEETEEEMTESEISIEEIKGTVFREDSARCLVCSTVANSHSADNQFVQMQGNSPVTSASHIPVVTKLAEVVADNQTQILKLNNEVICRRCFNLIDTVDCLETKLAAVKQDLIQLFETRLISLKALENWKVNQDIVEKAVDDPKSKIETSETISESISIKELEKENDKCDINETVTEEKSSDEICDSSEKNEDDLDDTKYVEEENKSNSSTTYVLSKDVVDEPKSPPNKYSCEVCSKLFSSKEYLNKHHQQQHTKQFSFYCDRCGKGFTFKRALENHLLLHSGEFRYQCEVCGKLFIQRYSLDDHLCKHQGKFRLACQFCEKGFNSRNSLRIHMRIHTGERPFVCQHCGKSFSFSSNLIAHIRVCSGDLPFSCSQCKKNFALETQLKTHVLSKHEGQYRFKCSVCGRGFTKDSDCKIHVRSHSREKPHKCTVCGKCYSSLGNLNQHTKQHDGERPFKCVVCSQGFLRRSTLAAHMNLHTGARPYNCDQCSKTFAAKRNLHAHKKWHEGTIKRYTCNVCGKTFNHGLQVHMRTHSGIKPYTCSDCGMAFTVRSTLNKHIKSKHQKITHFEKQS